MTLVTSFADDHPGIDLWPHQEAARAWAVARTSAYLGHDMGTGKTRTALAILEGWGVRRVLVACPLAVIPVWALEVERCDLDWDVCQLAKGTSEKRAELAAAASKKAIADGRRLMLVINYESLWRKPFASRIMQWAPHAVICDEAHRAKAPGGKLSKFLGRLGLVSRRRLALSGTPMPHSPLDLYAQFRFLDRSVFGTSNAKFKARYAIMDARFPRKVKAYQNQEELQNKFHAHCDIVASEDVLELLPTLDRRIEFELSAQERRVYRDLERHMIAEVEGGTITAANALAKLLRLQQVTGGHANDEGGVCRKIGESKKKALRDVLRDIPQGEHVVVFARFTADLAEIRACALDDARNYSELSGRTKQLDDWRESWGVLGVQVKSGGEGVDLTLARHCIYYSIGFSLGDYLQSRKRLDRPGQNRSVIYTHLVARGTVDARVYEALEQRKNIVDAIMQELHGRIAKGTRVQ